MSSKINLGIFAIATFTLMIAASIFGAINNAEAQQAQRLDTANKLLSYGQSGNLVNVAPPQIGVDVDAQVGKSNTASSTQSNVANTANKQCAICIESIQYNIGITAQVASDSNTAEREQSNTAITGDRSDALFVYGPNQNNIDIAKQIGGGLNTYKLSQSNAACTIACK